MLDERSVRIVLWVAGVGGLQAGIGVRGVHVRPVRQEIVADGDLEVAGGADNQPRADQQALVVSDPRLPWLVRPGGQVGLEAVAAGVGSVPQAGTHDQA